MLTFLRNQTHIINHIKQTSKTMFFKSSNESYNAYLAVTDFIENDTTIFVVTSNLYEAQKYYDTISQLVDSLKAKDYTH